LKNNISLGGIIFTVKLYAIDCTQRVIIFLKIYTTKKAAYLKNPQKTEIEKIFNQKLKL